MNFTLVKGDKGDRGIQGIQGLTGNGIASITKTGTSGLVDTYTITYTNGNTTTFTITNGEDGEVTETELDVLRQKVANQQKVINQLPQVTGQGTEVTLENTIEAQFTIFDVEGNSVQDGTPSPDNEVPIKSAGDNENLLSNAATSQTKNGIEFTVYDDGTVKANGTSTGYAIITIGNIQLPKGNYILSGCPTSGGNSTYLLRTQNGVNISDVFDTGSGANISITENSGSADIKLQISPNVTVNNLIFKPKLEKGNKATSYSPYGMGSINEKIQTKNLLEITEDNKLIHCSYVSGANTNEYKLLCTANDMYVNEIRNVGGKHTKTANGNLIPCEFGETIYFDTGNSSFKSCYFTEYDKDLVSLGMHGRQLSNGTYTPIASDCKYLTFRFGTGNSSVVGTTYTLAPIVCKTSGTTYVPYEEQDYSIFVQQPFRSIEDVRDCFVKKSDGKLYERHYFGKLEQLLDLVGPVEQGFYFIPQGIKKEARLLSTHQQLGTKTASEEWQRFDGSQMKQLYPTAHNGVYINYKADTKREQIDWWNSLNATLLYELEKPLDLPCTEEQIQQLENLPSTYKDFTIINSEDETPAYLEVSGIYDMNKLITRVEVIESEV